MKLHWLRCRASQSQFLQYWAPGKTNRADYVTNHHATIHHRAIRLEFLTPKCQLDLLSKRKARIQSAARVRQTDSRDCQTTRKCRYSRDKDTKIKRYKIRTYIIGEEKPPIQYVICISRPSNSHNLIDDLINITYMYCYDQQLCLFQTRTHRDTRTCNFVSFLCLWIRCYCHLFASKHETICV